MKTFTLAVIALLGSINAIALKDAEDFATIKDMVAQTEHYSEIDARQHEVKAAKDQQEMNASAEKLEENQKLLAKKMEELRTSEADAQSAQNFMERKSEIKQDLTDAAYAKHYGFNPNHFTIESDQF